MDIKIKERRGYGAGGFVGYLPEGLTITQINKMLGFRAQFKLGELDKVDHQWVFDIEGAWGHIYDYKGHRWHFGGSHAAFKLLILKMGWTLEGRQAVA